VHVIDSGRPQNLSSLFGEGEGGERIVIWDDGGAEHLDEERRAWEALNVSVRQPMTLRTVTVFPLQNDPEPSSDEDSDDDSHKSLSEDSADESVKSPSRKRRSTSLGSRSRGKRRRVDDRVRILLSAISKC
jgi:cell division control protein 45